MSKLCLKLSLLTAVAECSVGFGFVDREFNIIRSEPRLEEGVAFTMPVLDKQVFNLALQRNDHTSQMPRYSVKFQTCLLSGIGVTAWMKREVIENASATSWTPVEFSCVGKTHLLEPAVKVAHAGVLSFRDEATALSSLSSYLNRPAVQFVKPITVDMTSCFSVISDDAFNQSHFMSMVRQTCKSDQGVDVAEYETEYRGSTYSGCVITSSQRPVLGNPMTLNMSTAPNSPINWTLNIGNLLIKGENPKFDLQSFCNQTPRNLDLRTIEQFPRALETAGPVFWSDGDFLLADNKALMCEFQQPHVAKLHSRDITSLSNRMIESHLSKMHYAKQELQFLRLQEPMLSKLFADPFFVKDACQVLAATEELDVQTRHGTRT